MHTLRQIFYYSRLKLGFYLLFNLYLLLLSVLFTLTVFPQYPLVYYFAIGSCLLSFITALIVFIIPMPLAVITPQYIKIDRGRPLFWQNITHISKITFNNSLWSKSILRIYTDKSLHYKMNFMQKITSRSKFGTFSIPLYAMDAKSAQAIENTLRSYLEDK